MELWEKDGVEEVHFRMQVYLEKTPSQERNGDGNIVAERGSRNGNVKPISGID